MKCNLILTCLIIEGRHGERMSLKEVSPVAVCLWSAGWGHGARRRNALAFSALDSWVSPFPSCSALLLTWWSCSTGSWGCKLSRRLSFCSSRLSAVEKVWLVVGAEFEMHSPPLAVSRLEHFNGAQLCSLRLGPFSYPWINRVQVAQSICFRKNERKGHLWKQATVPRHTHIRIKAENVS